MKIAMLLFDDVTALDAIGPYEVLGSMPSTQLLYVGKQRGLLRTDRGLGLHAELSIDELTHADVLLVPGGFGARRAQRDDELLSWLRAIDARTMLTATVCTGSLLLGAAGLLRGRRATTHWAFFEQLAAHGALPTHERVVRDGKYATAAGVSAGIDLALGLVLELAGREAAESIQLALEYDPAPPLAAGHPSKVRSSLVDAVHARMHARDAELRRS